MVLLNLINPLKWILNVIFVNNKIHNMNNMIINLLPINIYLLLAKLNNNMHHLYINIMIIVILMVNFVK